MKSSGSSCFPFCWVFFFFLTFYAQCCSYSLLSGNIYIVELEEPTHPHLPSMIWRLLEFGMRALAGRIFWGWWRTEGKLSLVLPLWQSKPVTVYVEVKPFVCFSVYVPALLCSLPYFSIDVFFFFHSCVCPLDWSWPQLHQGEDQDCGGDMPFIQWWFRVGWP